MWFFLLFCSLCLPVYGQWFFVSPYGSDKHTGAIISQPLFSIQRALSFAQPGDTVVLQAGHYYQDVHSVRAGLKDSPITLRGDNDSVLHGGGKSHIIDLKHSYINLQGFVIDGKHSLADKQESYRNKLIYVKGSQPQPLTNISINNLTLKNALGECLRLKYWSNNNEIAYNSISNCGLLDYKFKGSKKNGEAIYVGTAPEQMKNQQIDASHLNHIHHNLIKVSGSECIDIKEGADNNLIEHNICTDAKDAHSGAISIRSRNNIVRFNYVANNQGAGVRLGGDFADSAINNQIYNNRIQHNQAGALKIMAWPQSLICGNIIEQPKGWLLQRLGKGIKPVVLRRCNDE